MTNRDLPEAGASPGLIDADRFLALAYVRARARDKLRAVWELDASLGAIVAAGNQPLVVQMKLAWWREALTRLDQGPAPAEPLLVSLSETIIPAGITGQQLSGLTEGWEYLLSPDPLTEEEAEAYARLRGARLFSLSARLLGGAPQPAIEKAGAAWTLVDLARRSSREEDGRLALDLASLALTANAPLPRNLLPLGLLAALARRDVRRGFARLERQGSPARMLRMLGYRLSGR